MLNPPDLSGEPSFSLFRKKYRIFTFRTFKCPIGESQYMRKEIIHRINQLGKEGNPFLFVIDYLGNQAFIEPPSVPFS